MKNIISRFVYFFISSKKEYLVYCSRSNSFLKLSEHFFDFLKQCKEKPSLILKVDQSLLSLLKKHKIIVEENEDSDFLLEREFAENQSAYLYSSLSFEKYV